MTQYKVVCIAGNPWYEIPTGVISIGPAKGEVCTVVREYYSAYDGEFSYDFAEYQVRDSDDGYSAKYFVRLNEDKFQQITYTKIIESEPVGVQ